MQRQEKQYQKLYYFITRAEGTLRYHKVPDWFKEHFRADTKYKIIAEGKTLRECFDIILSDDFKE